MREARREEEEKGSRVGRWVEEEGVKCVSDNTADLLVRPETERRLTVYDNQISNNVDCIYYVLII
jgi:hypothetical protein